MQTASSFVPAEFDGTRWEEIEPLLDDLASRTVTSREELEQWLVDRSELGAACSEAQATLYINSTRRTKDAAVQQAYERYIETIPPRMTPRAFELDKKLVELSAKVGLDAGEAKRRYEVLLRSARSEVELFREENVPIETELAKLSQKHRQIAGAMTVEFEGEEKTLPQMGKYQEDTDRDLRERAWRSVAERRLQDASALDDIYDKMIEKRTKLGRNAGFENYIGYAYKSKGRFDYGPADAKAFQDAVAKHVVPFNQRLAEQRAGLLGLDALRPWDLSVDVKGRGPLKPFEGGKQLFDRSLTVFNRLGAPFNTMFASLGEGLGEDGQGEHLDLDSRSGKAPGGYQYMRERMHMPFIFMNAAGVQRDVETMVHEAGHAFHSLAVVDEPLVEYRHAPLEFCEVASMSMELLTMPYWSEFYSDSDDLARARRGQVEDSVRLLAWIATIDQFQHWVYANPTHSRAERAAEWLRLEDRFGYMGRAHVEWSGIDPEIRMTGWQRQGHLFDVPFYYIEYGIAQLGALGLWLKSLEDGEAAALAAYRKAIDLGGSRPLPELFGAAGLPFDFGDATIARLVEAAERELEKLPA